MSKLKSTVLALSLAASPVMAEVVVIGNPAGPDTVSRNEVRDIFLNRSQELPGGQKAVPLEMPGGNATRSEFHQKVTGRNDAQLNAFWSQQVFTGRGQPPEEAANPASLKARISTTPGAIGYIDSAEVDDSVKVLLKP